jgi:antitoxin VapB
MGRVVGLNIKNEDTYRPVQELAKATGETQTAAVTTAVRERLERVRHQQHAGLADRLLATGRDVAGRLSEDLRVV